MKFSAASLFVFGVLIASAFAGEHKIPPGEGVATVAIPDKWQTKEQGEIVEGVSPDGTVSFLIIPAERKINESIGEAMRYIRWRGQLTVDAKSQRRESGKVNGVEARFLIWKAKDPKGEVEMKFSIFAPEPDEPLLAASWGAPAAIKKHQTELDRILKSVRATHRKESEDRQ